MAEAEGDDQPERRRRKRGLLKMFYGSNETAASSASADPLDIDGNAFKVCTGAGESEEGERGRKCATLERKGRKEGEKGRRKEFQCNNKGSHERS